MEGLTQERTLNFATARKARGNFTVQPLKVDRTTPAGKTRARLFKVAESGEMTVDEAWSKLKPEQRGALGDAVFEQARVMEAAAQKHRATDPNTAFNAALVDGKTG